MISLGLCLCVALFGADSRDDHEDRHHDERHETAALPRVWSLARGLDLLGAVALIDRFAGGAGRGRGDVTGRHQVLPTLLAVARVVEDGAGPSAVEFAVQQQLHLARLIAPHVFTIERMGCRASGEPALRDGFFGRGALYGGQLSALKAAEGAIEGAGDRFSQVLGRDRPAEEGVEGCGSWL